MPWPSSSIYRAPIDHGPTACRRTVVGHEVLIGERRIPYDQLVIAAGSRESYFEHDEWAAVTSGLKSIEDATTMRRRILIAFERAEDCEDEAERRRLLTFIIIGGGPTGVREVERLQVD